MKKRRIIKYHNIYLIIYIIYFNYDIIKKLFIYNYNNLDITIYLIFGLIYCILAAIHENKKIK